jgi:hypothetical protein
MSPIRLSTGRTVSPLRRPRLAAARDLRLGQTPLATLPATRSLAVKPTGTPQPWTAVLPNPAIMRVSGARLVPQASQEFGSRLEAPEVEAQDWRTWASVTPVGACLPDPRRLKLAGPPDLPVATEEGVADSGMAWLLPRLAPPLLDGPGSITPDPLAEHIRQAAQALLAEPSLLLADDQGVGKKLAACVALGTLMQQGHARHGLILCARSQIRAWVGLLGAWCPALQVSIAEGERLIRRRIWASQVNVILATYDVMAEDLSRGSLDPLHPRLDVLVIDGALGAIHLFPKAFSALAGLPVSRRWGLAGGLPPDNEDWRVLFHSLLPQQALPGPQDTVASLRDRFADFYLRRTKEEVRAELPAKQRAEIWLDLDDKQRRAYEEALAEERHRLEKLGSAVTRTHVEMALARLDQATAFAPGSFDGVKLRALLDVLEGITAGGDKLVLFSQYGEHALDQLIPPLEAYGALRLSASATEAERDQILGSFRRDQRRLILLADLEARGDGGGLPASHVLHFDITWNSARRSRAEIRFYPELKPAKPLNIYEFWVAGTHDEALYHLLDERHLLPRDLPHGTQPAELEERLGIKDWLTSVFWVGEAAARPKPGSSAVSTGLLPGTATLRGVLEALSEDELLHALEQLMEGLGFPHSQQLETAVTEGQQPHRDVLGWRRTPEGEERALGRVIRADKNIGVAEGRALLNDLDERGDCLGAYLVTTADFTAACRSLADESNGRLALVSGSEFYRHLHILRWL